MAKRVHVDQVRMGRITLDKGEAHHLRDVLRLEAGAAVVVFDNAGAAASGTLHIDADRAVSVDVQSLSDAPKPPRVSVRVLSAVPKGDRADWMVEKLSELGVSAFIPLQAERSVVVPRGTGKSDRWSRIAIESAKQSHRPGVLSIEPLVTLAQAIESTKADHTWFLSTAPGAVAIQDACNTARTASAIALFIGPEGGWTVREIEAMTAARWTPVRLTGTILRIETAAVAAAAIALTCLG